MSTVAASLPERVHSVADACAAGRDLADPWPHGTTVAPADLSEARRDLGRQLAAWRDTAGVKQMDLARRTCYSRSTIANVETGRQNIPRAFWAHADQVLGAAGSLVKAFEHLDGLVREYNRQIGRARKQEHQQAVRRGSPKDLGVLDGALAEEKRRSVTVAQWSGREARALREAMRLPVRVFAVHLGVTASTVSAWESKQASRPLRLTAQGILDQALKRADVDVLARFCQLLKRRDNVPAPCAACGHWPSCRPSSSLPIAHSSPDGGAQIYSMPERRVS
ncbi:hypothetical protein Prum_068470 [Phytohabitans rumicis]|uniref:HTH cro/C1-type domain-containing protein n=1 Tax=Phytohabitans rumicis TaxID=1076125 RepID=A0A6V8LKN6_9ACTN|nr:hypothetical protein Prum_068470 [Phytohabitans rumicis]